MAFDPAWKECHRRGLLSGLNVDEQIEAVIKTVDDHPFIQSSPEQARQVAKFRVRLLDLSG
ncbi:hypothetical protein [Synechococcus sp. CS-197]|uniref:hypothetical protein n=1 Tax=Synechococcus sp. CS-197 TaxID=2847985 RepID=UPI0003159699|nr:hypothetical protein [Synechococcus sp. CS-197]